MASSIILPILQIVVIVGLSPLAKGFINKMEARIQFRRGELVYFNVHVQEFQSCPRKDSKIAKFIFRVFSSVSWVICCCRRQPRRFSGQILNNG